MITYEAFIQNILDTRGRFGIPEGEYKERHHIVPRHKGGTDDDDNLIDLYAREHFEVHRILALETNDYYDILAWEMMAYPKGNTKRDFEITAKEYEEIKKALSKGGMSDDQKKKISESNKLTWSLKSEEEKNRFRESVSIAWKNRVMPPRTEEHIKKIKNSLKVYWSKLSIDEKKKIYDKVSTSLLGRKLKEETKEKISLKLTGIKRQRRTKEHSEKIVKTKRERYDLTEVAKKAWETRINNGNYTGIKVICVESSVVYESISAANRAIGLKINYALDKDNKTAGGYHWKRLM